VTSASTETTVARPRRAPAAAQHARSLLHQRGRRLPRRRRRGSADRVCSRHSGVAWQAVPCVVRVPRVTRPENPPWWRHGPRRAQAKWQWPAPAQMAAVERGPLSETPLAPMAHGGGIRGLPRPLGRRSALDGECSDQQRISLAAGQRALRNALRQGGTVLGHGSQRSGNARSRRRVLHATLSHALPCRCDGHGGRRHAAHAGLSSRCPKCSRRTAHREGGRTWPPLGSNLRLGEGRQ
jgi:hypothetical protein